MFLLLLNSLIFHGFFNLLGMEVESGIISPCENAALRPISLQIKSKNTENSSIRRMNELNELFDEVVKLKYRPEDFLSVNLNADFMNELNQYQTDFIYKKFNSIDKASIFKILFSKDLIVKLTRETIFDENEKFILQIFIIKLAFYAVKMSNIGLLWSLLDIGLSSNIKYPFYYSPYSAFNTTLMHHARSSEILKLLAEYNAQASIDSNGLYPIDIYLEYYHHYNNYEQLIYTLAEITQGGILKPSPRDPLLNKYIFKNCKESTNTSNLLIRKIFTDLSLIDNKCKLKLEKNSLFKNALLIKNNYTKDEIKYYAFLHRNDIENIHNIFFYISGTFYLDLIANSPKQFLDLLKSRNIKREFETKVSLDSIQKLLKTKWEKTSFEKSQVSGIEPIKNPFFALNLYLALIQMYFNNQESELV